MEDHGQQEPTIEESIGPAPPGGPSGPAPPGGPIPGKPSWLPDLADLGRILAVKTGPGDITQYQQHPLCFDGSPGLAQMIRGVSGITTDLDLAAVDLAVGFYRWRGSRATVRRNESEETTQQGRFGH